MSIHFQIVILWRLRNSYSLIDLLKNFKFNKFQSKLVWFLKKKIINSILRKVFLIFGRSCSKFFNCWKINTENWNNSFRQRMTYQQIKVVWHICSFLVMQLSLVLWTPNCFWHLYRFLYIDWAYSLSIQFDLWSNEIGYFDA